MDKCPICGYNDPGSMTNKPMNHAMTKYQNKDNPKEVSVFNDYREEFTTRDKAGVEKTWVKYGSTVAQVPKFAHVPTPTLTSPTDASNEVITIPVTSNVAQVLAEMRAKSVIQPSAAPVGATAPAVVLSNKEPVVDTVN